MLVSMLGMLCSVCMYVLGMYACMYVWSDLFQSVLLPPLLDGLALMSLLPLCLGKGIFCDLLGVKPVRQEVLWQTLGGSLAWLDEAVVQNLVSVVAFLR